jgi:hypothetical protein
MDIKLLTELVNQGLSIAKIGIELKCSQSTVCWWLRKNNLKTKRGKHSKWPKDLLKLRRCSHCLETNPNKFYGHKKTICGSCQNKKVRKVGTQRRLEGIRYLGNKCKVCGYSQFTCSLDFHHINPNTKDKDFKSYRGWSQEKLFKELDKCILLCKNCHAALHKREIDINLYKPECGAEAAR